MKKLLIIFLLFLTGCDKFSILNTVYISSIGIDYVDGEYYGYFYSPPSKDISKDGDSSSEATVYVIKETELSKLFDSMFDSDPVNINMLHLKTMILSNDFNDVEVLLDYFRFSTRVSYNFHVFITNDELSEIYKYKSMSNISNLYNFLNSPSLINYEEHGVSKCHFLSFANNFLNVNRYVNVPVVKIEHNSLNETDFQLKIDGYSNLEFIYLSSEYEGIIYLVNGEKEISHNNEIVLLKNYKVEISSIDIFVINISYTKVKVSSNLDSSAYIENKINQFLYKIIDNEGSLSIIKQYNYLYDKNLKTTEYKINIIEK
ncbi:MAG: hypothetical protein R3Y60_00400 [bacterium]